MPTHRRAMLACLAAALLAGGPLASGPRLHDAEPPRPRFAPDWKSLAKREPAPAWFRDAKLGIYFHWGVYSVPAFGDEWYPRNMHFEQRPEYKHHVETYGHPSKFGYHDFVPAFKAERFEANEWAELFAKAGARFAGPVAEHHDGFSMWASKVNPWNARDMGPKRDVTGELAKAIRARGMRLITTFHHDRHCQLYQDQPDEKEFRDSHYPYIKGMPPTSEDPLLKILYGNIPRDTCYEKYWLGKLTEVIDGYRPDIIWFDSWLDRIPEARRLQFAAYYLNRAAEWGKEVVITYKQEDLPPTVGVLDLEKGRMGDVTARAWLTDDTISKGSWCYTRDLQIKPTSVVLHSLIDIVSKNGVLLLNISPRADGTIPDDQKAVLLGLGEWLGKFGEAIYGTRPWIRYGEGPTQLPQGRFGGFTDKAGGYVPQDIRYTRKGKAVYVIALGWPGAGTELLCRSFAAGGAQTPPTIARVTLLGSREEVRWKLGPDGLSLTTPTSKVHDLAIVFKVETS
jgi:alpha-L-fucosidase